jgi:16S rRNA (adenine1518-N6/adenine1519-N6)-dimethyltransferase
MFTPKKKLGQNFLKNKHKIKEMVKALDPKEGEVVVEIGPGLGAVTEVLIDNYGHSDMLIKAVEIDVRFVDKLINVYADYEKFEVIEANVLNWLPTFDPVNRNFRIIGSLPYYITSPIIHEIIMMKKLPEVCILLIQKEVAQKISRKSPKSSYIATFVQTFFEVEYKGKVDKGDFSPVPKVDGGVLKLTKRPDIKIDDITKYEGFLHRAFSNPRKMLNKVFHQDELNRAGLSGKARAQEYSWEKWYKAFKILV